MSETHSPKTVAAGEDVMSPSRQLSGMYEAKGNNSTEIQQEVAAQELSPRSHYEQMKLPIWIALVACIFSGSFLFGFDFIVTANIQSEIVRDLGEVEKLPWISVAYTLGGMSTMLLWGRMYTLFNIKWVSILTLVVFEAGCALSGAAADMDSLIVGRALSGSGAIGLYLGSMNMISAVTSTQQRPLYISFNTIAYGISTIVAPFLGGAFADSQATWRWAFYINICIGAFFLPGCLWLFPSRRFSKAAASVLDCVRRMDLVGNALWAGATTAGLMAISFGGTIFAWASAQMIALFVISGLLWGIFVLQQWRAVGTIPDARIFTGQFFRSTEMCLLFGQTLFSTTVATVPLFLVPLYFQLAQGASAVSSALQLLPFVALRSVFVLINGAMMRKYGYVMPWHVVGACLGLAGSAPFLKMQRSTPTTNVYGYSVLIGCGVGMYNQASFAVTQACTPPAMMPQAVTFIATTQFLGIAIPLAVSNSIFINRAIAMITRVLPDPTAESLKQAITSSGGISMMNNLTPEQRQAVTSDLVEVLNSAWIVVVIAAAASVISSPFVRRRL